MLDSITITVPHNNVILFDQCVSNKTLKYLFDTGAAIPVFNITANTVIKMFNAQKTNIKSFVHGFGNANTPITKQNFWDVYCIPKFCLYDTTTPSKYIKFYNFYVAIPPTILNFAFDILLPYNFLSIFNFTHKHTTKQNQLIIEFDTAQKYVCHNDFRVLNFNNQQLTIFEGIILHITTANRYCCINRTYDNKNSKFTIVDTFTKVKFIKNYIYVLQKLQQGIKIDNLSLVNNTIIRYTKRRNI